MTTYRTKQRLGVETSKKSVNTDTYLNINLDGKEKLLPAGDINNIVNVGDRFDVERQRSKYYRILGTINPVMGNPLFNLTDNIYADKQTWAGFNRLAFLDTSYPKDNNVSDDTDLTYPNAIKRYLKELDGWFGYTNPDKTTAGLCEFIVMEPKRERFSFTPDINSFNNPINSTFNLVKNWELSITYPEKIDDTHPMVNGLTNGLMIVEEVAVTVANRSMVALGIPCLHNLKIGDTVNVTGTSGYDGVHVVVRTGLDNGDLKGYYFVIDLPPTGSLSNNSRMKRIFNNQESKYYFRIFKKIKTRNAPVIETDDYETYKLAFSKNVYEDDLSQFVFNEDVDITDLKDNLGRPLSELYLTMVKTDSDGLFSQVSSGIETPFLPRLKTSNTNTYLQDIPAINRIHNGGTLPFPTHNPLELNVNINNTQFYGDLVEYNRYEVKETVLADVSHRFNTFNRETTATISGGYVSSIGDTPTNTPLDLGPRQEGYFYKAHSLIKIKVYSSYVEQGDASTEGIPEYAEDLGDGRYLWRDLLDIGFNESDTEALDYPFLNGCHYMYQNNCFTLRRQDPFNDWGLYYASFPADPIGERITDKYTFNGEEDVC